MPGCDLLAADNILLVAKHGKGCCTARPYDFSQATVSLIVRRFGLCSRCGLLVRGTGHLSLNAALVVYISSMYSPGIILVALGMNKLKKIEVLVSCGAPAITL